MRDHGHETPLSPAKPEPLRSKRGPAPRCPRRPRNARWIKQFVTIADALCVALSRAERRILHTRARARARTQYPSTGRSEPRRHAAAAAPITLSVAAIPKTRKVKVSRGCDTP
jgi:hypothetical protein